MGWAQVWRGVSRREEAERLLALDPHSPMDLRANAVRNLTEFHEAFGSPRATACGWPRGPGPHLLTRAVRTRMPSAPVWVRVARLRG